MYFCHSQKIKEAFPQVVAGVLGGESLGMLQAFFRAKREANKTQ